jgi:transaldolase
MLTEAAELAGWGENAVIKLPLTPDGLKACKTLEDAGTRTNVTLCFSANQALLAAKAGASYVSPFIGRLDDISEVGMDLIHNMRLIFDNYDFRTQILAASIRNPVHVLESALAGADVATIPFSVFSQLVKHPLTDIGLANFLADWEKRKQ